MNSKIGIDTNQIKNKLNEKKGDNIPSKVPITKFFLQELLNSVVGNAKSTVIFIVKE